MISPWIISFATSCLVVLHLLVAAAPAQAAEYKLGAEDKVRISIYEWPALGGEFAIASSGRIALPFIGEVHAQGVSTQELQNEVSARLQVRAKLLERPDVTIEVVQFRPFYIVGEVQRPGEYSFRPGMIVLNALSVAGGRFRPNEPALARLERDAINARSNLELLTVRRFEILARQSRLRAEFQRQSTISFPAELTEGQNIRLGAGLLGEERAIFLARRQTMESQIRILRDLSSLYAEEIKSLNVRKKIEEKQIASITKELDDVRSLVAKGLTPAPRQLALERTAAQIESDYRELDTLVLRAQQNISETEQTMEKLRGEREKEISIELRQSVLQLEEVNRQLETARKLIYEAEVTAPTLQAGALGERHVPVIYTIMRREGEKVMAVQASETTVIAPGDIIKVELKPQEGMTYSAGVGAVVR